MNTLYKKKSKALMYVSERLSPASVRRSWHFLNYVEFNVLKNKFMFKFFYQTNSFFLPRLDSSLLFPVFFFLFLTNQKGKNHVNQYYFILFIEQSLK